MTRTCPNNMPLFYTLFSHSSTNALSFSMPHTHTPLTLIFFIYFPFSSADPEVLSADIMKESQRIHAHTLRSPSELSLQGAGEKQWEAWSISDSYSSGWKIERGKTGKRGGQKGGIIRGKYLIFLRNDCVDSLCKGSGEGSLGRQKREEIKWVISMEKGNQLLYVIGFKPTSVWPITIYPCAVSDNRRRL